jgi:hypothetical protein
MKQKRGNHLYKSKEILTHNERRVRLMYNESLKTERKDGVEVISHEAGVEVIS